jgi:translation elongation factor EF-Tu-like GTPase
MTDEPIKPTKPRLKIGLIGHVAHGKTSVAAAITKFYGDEDEEKRAEDVRKIRSIEL